MNIDEKLTAAGLNVSADTPEDVKELLLQKHEEGLAFKAQAEEANANAEAITAEAEEEIAKAREAAKNAEAKAASFSGFGRFNHDGEDYVLTMKQTQVFNKDSEWEIITAEEIIESKELQARVIENKWGIAQLKSKFDAANKKGGK